MPLFAEYAITPDVLFSSFYSSVELEHALLNPIVKSIMAHGLVRDLRDGEWSALLNSPEWRLSPRSKSILAMLKNERRLHSYPPILSESPLTGKDWCTEALASHNVNKLSGIITTQDVACNFRNEPCVASINELGEGVNWWNPDGATVQVDRNIDAYIQNLKLILSHANTILFVDAYIDPWGKSKYKKFVELIKIIANRKRMPSRVQIHRQEAMHPNSENIIEKIDWQKRFEKMFLPIIKGKKLKIEIFIWDYVHDRYLLTDIAGIHMGNGFDEKSFKDSIGTTTWSRLDKETLETNYNNYFHDDRKADHLRHKITIG